MKFIHAKNNTPSPGYLKGWGVLKITAVTLGPKNLFKNSYSRLLRIINTMVASIASRRDRLNKIYVSSN